MSENLRSVLVASVEHQEGVGLPKEIFLVQLVGTELHRGYILGGGGKNRGVRQEEAGRCPSPCGYTVPGPWKTGGFEHRAGSKGQRVSSARHHPRARRWANPLDGFLSSSNPTRQVSLSQTERSQFEFWLCHFLDVCPRTREASSQSLSFPLCNTGLTAVHTSEHCHVG